MRKFFGIILLILGYFLALCTCLTFFSQALKTINTNLEPINKISFLTGTFIGMGLLAGFCYLLIRWGIRLTKKKNVDDILKKIESIE